MFAFIDISGCFKSTPEKEPYIVASAVCVRQHLIGDITRVLHNLKRDILLNETLEYRANSFINKSTLSHPELNKHLFNERVFERCFGSGDCQCFAVVIPNRDIRPSFQTDHLSKHYIYLIQRIQKLAEEYQRPKAIIAIDNEQRKVDKRVAYAFSNYLYRTAGGTQMDRILEIPLFVDSEMTIGIQLADAAAGVIRLYHRNDLHHMPSHINEPNWIKKLRDYYSMLEQATRNYKGLFGIYRCNPDFLLHYYDER